MSKVLPKYYFSFSQNAVIRKHIQRLVLSRLRKSNRKSYFSAAPKLWVPVLLLVFNLGACQLSDNSESASHNDYYLPVMTQDTQQQKTIRLLNVSNGSVMPLTGVLAAIDSGENKIPSWSDDSSKAAYLKSLNGQTSLYWAYSDGSAGAIVSDQLCGAGQPAWSPDNHLLGYVALNVPCSSAGSGSPPVNPLLLKAQAYVFDTSTGNNIALTKFANEGVCDIAWSPDGSRLAFQTSCASLETGTMPSLYVIRKDGTELRKLVDTSDVILRITIADRLQPRWSASGDRIYFQATTANESGSFEWTIFATDWPGGQTTRIASQDTEPSQTAWSPVADEIAVQKQNQGIAIYDINHPNSPSSRINATCAQPGGFAWSLDGKAIAFGSCGKVYIADAATGNARELALPQNLVVAFISDQWIRMPTEQK